MLVWGSTCDPPRVTLQADRYFEPFYSDPYWLIRLIHYPWRVGGDELGCGEHTDYGCLTLILADDTPGALQVLGRSSNEWLQVDPVSGAYTCNIGDMLARWTNGLFVSTPHRVICPLMPTSRTGNVDFDKQGDAVPLASGRLSVPFFFEPNYQAIVAPLAECCALTGEEPKYDPIMYGDHLLSKVTSNFVKQT